MREVSGTGKGLGEPGGTDAGAPVVEGVWQSPFRFSGKIHQVIVDVSGELIVDEEAELRQLMAGQ